MDQQEQDSDLQLVSGDELPEGEVRQHEVNGTLYVHIDADDADHPLEKKAMVWGKPVKVRC